MAKAKKPRAGKRQHPKVKAGTSKVDAAQRRALFVNEYIANGGNATQAAIKVGFNQRSAYARGHELVKDREIQEAIEVKRAELLKISGLSVERTLREVARIAYSDPRKLYDKDGNLIPIHQLDDDTAATVASIKVVEMAGGAQIGGEAGVQHIAMHTKEIKHWDKNSALDKAMKHHGLYEKDNKQVADALGSLLGKVDGAVLRPAGAAT
jgi:phage terminase small subunit